MSGLTVLTNSIQVLLELSGRPGIVAIGTGGTLRETALSFVGPIAERTMAEHHVDKAFLSCKGLSVEKGLTDSNELEVELKKLMIRAAQEVIVLADHTKFGYTGFARIATIDAIDTIVTDDGVDPKEIQPFIDAGINVIVAGES